MLLVQKCVSLLPFTSDVQGFAEALQSEMGGAGQELTTLERVCRNHQRRTREGRRTRRNKTSRTLFRLYYDIVY